jgi:hypothetical protein
MIRVSDLWSARSASRLSCFWHIIITLFMVTLNKTRAILLLRQVKSNSGMWSTDLLGPRAKRRASCSPGHLFPSVCPCWACTAVRNTAISLVSLSDSHKMFSQAPMIRHWWLAASACGACELPRARPRHAHGTMSVCIPEEYFVLTYNTLGVLA